MNICLNFIFQQILFQPVSFRVSNIKDMIHIKTVGGNYWLNKIFL